MSIDYYEESYPIALWTAPVFSTLAPGTGVNGQSVTLTLTGTGFHPRSQVMFGTIAVPTTYVSPTSLTAIVNPLPAAGTYQVTVANGGGVSGNKPFVVT